MAIHRSRPAGQRGYVLLAVMLLMTLMLLTLSIELPRIGQQIKREKEEELIHRGNEYKNAIKRFYRKNGRYPLSIDDLEKGNNLRFLRKRYKDPFTGKDDWRLLHVGEVQLNLGGGANATTPLPTFGGGPTPQPISGGAAGTPTGSPSGIPGASTPGTPIASETGGGNQGSVFGLSGGGGPIIGVASTKKSASIKSVDKKDHYNDWLFFYDPRLEQQQRGGPVPPGVGPPPPGAGGPPPPPLK
jgi:type II secretory pathway pseudopilin PulG